MAIRKVLVSLAAVASLSLAGVGAAAPVASAATHAKPTASLTITNDKVNAKARFAIKYSSAHLPSGSTLYLQWQVGSAHVWKRYAVLKGTSGSTSLLGQPLGKYEFRILASTKTTTVAYSSDRVLYSYGNVAMQTICSGLIGSSNCQPQTEEVGSTVFTYVVSSYARIYPKFYSALQGSSTTCRSAAIGFAADGQQAGTVYARVEQAKINPENASTPYNEVGKLSATFAGGAWSFDLSTTSEYGPVANGTFSCYTASGF
jgi:hypothetical protein